MKKNARAIETNVFSLLEAEKNYRQHINNLVKIAGDKKSYINKQRIIYDHDIRLQKSQDALKKQHEKKMLEIQKGNDRLVGNLQKITLKTHRKAASMSQAKLQASPPPSFDSSKFGLETGRGANSNSINRKKEILRILEENARITQRLSAQESAFPKEKLDREYEKMKVFSDRMRKVKINPDKTSELGHGGITLSQNMRIQTRLSLLPPLQSHSMTASTFSLSERTRSMPKLQTQLTTNSNKSTPYTGYSMTSRTKSSGLRLLSQGPLSSRTNYTVHPSPSHSTKELLALDNPIMLRTEPNQTMSPAYTEAMSARPSYGVNVDTEPIEQVFLLINSPGQKINTIAEESRLKEDTKKDSISAVKESIVKSKEYTTDFVIENAPESSTVKTEKAE